MPRSTECVQLRDQLISKITPPSCEEVKEIDLDSYNIFDELEEVMEEFKKRKTLIEDIKELDGRTPYDIYFLKKMIDLEKELEVEKEELKPCEYIVKSGKNKGKKCGRVRCSTHIKKTHKKTCKGIQAKEKCSRGYCTLIKTCKGYYFYLDDRKTMDFIDPLIKDST